MSAAEPPENSIEASSGRHHPIRVGVIGLGRWGSRLADALRRSARFRLEAVCDAATERLPTDPSLLSTERSEVLLGAGLEAVVIATNPAQHAELAVAALQAGHHVFVEKPCSLSTEGAERIQRAAETARRVACVGHLLRYHAAFERLVELGTSGELGTLLGAVAERVGSRPRTDVDSWWMLAPHDLSVSYALFGRGADEVRRWRVGEDEFLASARFGLSGVALWVRSGGQSSRRFALVGTRKVALFDDLSDPGCIRLLPAGAPRLRELSLLCSRALGLEQPSALEAALSRAFEEPAELLRFVAPPPLERELDGFASAIRNGTRVTTDAREGAAVVAMLDVPPRERLVVSSSQAEASLWGVEP